MDATDESFLKTKIVCTIGPSSSDRETLAALCAAGMDVARINMAHGEHKELRGAVRRIRECAAEFDRPVALLADLQGSKIRVAHLDAPVQLSPGDSVTLAPADVAGAGDLPVTYAKLASDLSVGDRVLIHDGWVELVVREIETKRVMAEVVIGGEVETGHGINLPGVQLSAPVLSERDIADLDFALEVGVDIIALSFVRRAADVRALRARVPDDVLIVIKIEKDVALGDLEGILHACDAVMVARGDLGSELPFEQVPLVQKRIVRMANLLYRPVIIATQMLETMIERPRPTRAEVSDVANAILDGTDAVMLAAETAAGRYPVESVRALTRVIQEIESSPLLSGGPAYDVPIPLPHDGHPVATEVAVAGATVEAVRLIGAPAIVTFTKSGFTARVVSSRRPPVPILAVTDTRRVYRQLSLVWGVLPILCEDEPTDENMWAVAQAELKRRGIATSDDRIVVTAGVPFHVRGTTNMVRIETV